MWLIENKDSEEEARMINQAELGHMIRRSLVMRCQSMTTGDSGGGPPMTRLSNVYQERLQKHEDRSRVATIHQVIIGGCDRRSCGGTGTIEAHVNGFEYSDCILNDYVVIMYDNVKWCFYGLGNEMQPPLMQFHLKRPIKTGNSEAKDIQIRVVPLSYENMESVRNEDLKNFIHKVQESQPTCESEVDSKPIDFQALDEFQFKAADLPTGAPTTFAVTRYALVADLPTGAPTTCALTRHALVVLTKEPPYLVVPLLEIQFVNLACFGDGIEMTVVFADMKRNVLQLRSIPIGYLTDIKHRLNRADVKYYVNSLRPNWSEGVRLNRDLPEVFLADGGWDFLEDSLTLAKYPPVDPGEDFDRALKDAERFKRARRDSESEEEAARMMNQAKLGDLSRRFIVQRCWLQSRTRDSSGEGPPMTKLRDVYQEKLQKYENGWVARIDRVMVGGFVRHYLTYRPNGFIEAHVNGFEYSDHTLNQCTVIMHDDVEWCFYGSGNEQQPPLMQFHLKHPIKIYNLEMKDIQIRLMSGRYYKHMERVDDLKNFIHKVEESQRTCESEWPFITPVDFQALDEFQFDAARLPSGAPTSCALTRSALVVLLKEPAPYLVVPLVEIQFVNLACFGDGIEMTVVFEELERDVFQLGSIPLKFLTGIKRCLNREDVKYYVNSLRPDWSDKLRLHRERTEVFLAGGGWDFLEDSLTLAKYPHFDPHSVREEYEREYEDFEREMREVVYVDPRDCDLLRRS